ncbi:MAG: hydrogenase maturation protease [Campylobacterales bacterium]
MKTLVIGIGNTIRCDDGIGFKLAQMVEKETIEGVEVICTHQLLPELSEDISKYEVVIFVDASTLLECGKIAFEEIEKKEIEELSTHYLTPEILLELSFDFYDKVPQAYSVHIGMCSDELNENLSPAIYSNVDSYKQQIVNFLQSF